jgi:AcrR family transcriptional regulator
MPTVSTRQTGDARRDQIARAVLSLASETGMSAVSVAAVAARVGVAPSALYRHYTNKGAMLDDTLERLSAGVLRNLAAARAAHDDPLEALGDLFERHVALIRQNRGIPLVMFSEDFFHDPRRRRRLVALVSSFRRGIEALVREAQRRGQVRRELDPSTLSLMFFGLFQAPAILWHLSGGRTDLTGRARRAWAVFHHGIRARGVRPRPRSRPRRRRAQETSS